MNGGLQVVNPSSTVYQLILDYLSSDAAIDLDFADQSLLSDLFKNRWVPLPYIYNALKTLRWEGVHPQIWRDDKVKNMHYILAPKPWDEMNERGEFIGKDETHGWWVKTNQERLKDEEGRGIRKDGF
jgi:lipopolysaccharide biosynthesis glycosyltransferase